MNLLVTLSANLFLVSINSERCERCEGTGIFTAFLGNPNLEGYGNSHEEEELLHFHHSANGRYTLKSCFTFHSTGRINAGEESQVCKSISY